MSDDAEMDYDSSASSSSSSGSSDADVPLLLSPPAPASNIQAQCEAIASAPMTPARRCYLCYVERRRKQPVFADLNTLLDTARRVFERFATDSPGAREEMKEHFQTYVVERRKQVRTARSAVGAAASSTKKGAILVYEEITFDAFYEHFVKHLQTRTQDTLVKNDTMNKQHDVIMERIKKMDNYISTGLDAKEYKAKSACLVNEMRALLMLNQMMHMPRYADINTPVRTIQK